jgi:hypothetical protein
MLVIFFGSVAPQLHLGSGYKSETKAKTALNPQVNKIQSHSFKRYPNSLGDQQRGSLQAFRASGVPINAYDIWMSPSFPPP